MKNFNCKQKKNDLFLDPNFHDLSKKQPKTNSYVKFQRYESERMHQETLQLICLLSSSASIIPGRPH